MGVTSGPKVSVIIPYRHSAELLTSKVHAVLNQSYTNVEIVVVRHSSINCEPPTFDAKLTKLAEVKFIDSSSSGQPLECLWMEGISHASAEFCWIANIDDQSDHFFLEKLISKLGKDADMAFADSESIDYLGLPIHNSDAENHSGRGTEENSHSIDSEMEPYGIRRYFCKGPTMFHISAILFKRSLIDVNSVPTDLVSGYANWLVWAHASLTASTVYYCRERLNFPRLCLKSYTTQPDDALLEEIAALAIVYRTLDFRRLKRTKNKKSLVNAFKQAITCEFTRLLIHAAGVYGKSVAFKLAWKYSRLTLLNKDFRRAITRRH